MPARRKTAFDHVKPSDITLRINNALARLHDEEERKALPSPSALEDCTRKVFLQATGFPYSEPVNIGTALAIEQGKAEEVIVPPLLLKAGFTILSEQVAIAEPDEIGCKEGTADLIVMDSLDNQKYVADTKRLGLFRFLKLVQHGVRKAHVNYYTQLSQYCYSFGIDKALVIGISADYSAVRGHWTKNRYPPDKIPPPIWTEEFRVDENWIKNRIERAHDLTYYIEEVTDPRLVPREFNPSVDNFPCNYCRFKSACLEIGDGHAH